MWNVTFLCLGCYRVLWLCWWQGCKRVVFLLGANKIRADFFLSWGILWYREANYCMPWYKGAGVNNTMCWELQLRVQQGRAYIKCPCCQGEWQRWLKARQELLSAPGRVTALLITKSILLTSDMGIQNLFGKFYLFWPREGRWAAPLGASLLLWQLDKLIQAGSSGGWNFLHPLSFLYLFFPPPAGLYCRKDKKKSVGIVEKSSSGAVPDHLWSYSMGGSESWKFVVLCLQLCTNLCKKGTAQPQVSPSSPGKPFKVQIRRFVCVPLWLR